MRISDWSSDVCSSDLAHTQPLAGETVEGESLLLEQLLCLPVHGDGEVLPPVLAEVQVGAAAAAADGDDAPLDQLEAAEPLAGRLGAAHGRSEEHTSELQSLMRISYAVFCLKKKNRQK